MLNAHIDSSSDGGDIHDAKQSAELGHRGGEETLDNDGGRKNDIDDQYPDQKRDSKLKSLNLRLSLS